MRTVKYKFASYEEICADDFSVLSNHFCCRVGTVNWGQYRALTSGWTMHRYNVDISLTEPYTAGRGMNPYNVPRAGAISDPINHEPDNFIGCIQGIMRNVEI